jgi:hypothetical protein
MKYVISESRFENLISNYLDDSLRNIESHTQVIEGEVYNWWGVGDTPMFVLNRVRGKLGIAYDEQYVSSLSNLFGISDDDAKSYILKWINSKLDIHPEFTIKQEMF